MSALPVVIIITLTLFIWAVAIVASNLEGEEKVPPQAKPRNGEEPAVRPRKAA